MPLLFKCASTAHEQLKKIPATQQPKGRTKVSKTTKQPQNDNHLPTLQIWHTTPKKIFPSVDYIGQNGTQHICLYIRKD